MSNKLTAKQEKFAQGIASGLGQADAYRQAYDASRMKDNTIYRKAGEVMKNGMVTARIAELREAVEAKQLWTREMSIKALISACEEGGASVKIAAIRELNLMHGFNAPVKTETAITSAPSTIITISRD